MKAILVQLAEGRIVTSICPDHRHLTEFMSARGFEMRGVTEFGGRLRNELRGRPTFHGLHGPSYGGSEHPLRYETPEANEVLSL